MKPIKRKLYGAQRVVSLQADVMRLRAAAEELEAMHPRNHDFWVADTPGQQSAGVAWEAAHAALAELHSFSPKRALALAAKLDLIRPSWPPPSKKLGRRGHHVGGIRYKNYRDKNEAELSAPLPIGRSRADQRKLKKARDGARRTAR